MSSEVCKNYANNIMPYLHSDIKPEHKSIVLAYGVILAVFIVVSFAIFIITKNKVVYSKQKSTFSSIGCLIGTLLLLSDYVFREYIGREIFNCITLACLFHVPMLLLVSQPIGTLYFYMYRLRQERMKTYNIKKMFNDDIEVQSQTSIDQTIAPPNSLFKRHKTYSTDVCTLLTEFWFVWRYSKDGKIIIPGEDQATETAVKPSLDLTNSPHLASHQRTHPTTDASSKGENSSTMESFMVNVGIPVIITVFLGFPYIVGLALRIHLDPLYKNGCRGCTLTYLDFLLKISLGAIYYSMVAVGLYCMRNEADTLRIFREFKVAVVWGVVIFICWILNIISSLNGVHDRAILNLIEIIAIIAIYYAFVPSGVVAAMLQQKKWNLMSDSKKLQQNATIISTSNAREYSMRHLPPPSAIDVNLILLEPKARNAFLEHSINEISSENLVFVFKLRAWKSIWEKEKGEKVNKIAIALFQEYLSKDSKNQVNVSHAIYTKTELEFQPYLGNQVRGSETQTVDEEHANKRRSLATKINKDVFDDCERECVQMLEHDALPRFVRSDLFKVQIVEGGILNKVLKQ